MANWRDMWGSNASTASKLRFRPRLDTLDGRLVPSGNPGDPPPSGPPQSGDPAPDFTNALHPGDWLGFSDDDGLVVGWITVGADRAVWLVTGNPQSPTFDYLGDQTPPANSQPAANANVSVVGPVAPTASITAPEAAPPPRPSSPRYDPNAPRSITIGTLTASYNPRTGAWTITWGGYGNRYSIGAGGGSYFWSNPQGLGTWRPSGLPVRPE